MAKWPLPEGWEWKTLSEIAVINPSRPKINRPDEILTSFVPMQAVDEGEGRIADMQIRPFGEIKRGYTYFAENDVLLAKITPSMENGKTAIARGLIDGLGFGTTEFHVFRSHECVLPEWLFYFIRRKAFRAEAKNNFRGAVGQQRVPQDFLISLPIPIPYPDDPVRSLAEQRRIVARLEALLGEVHEMRALQAQIEADVGRLMGAVLAEVFDDLSAKYPNQSLGDNEICEIFPGQHILSKDYRGTPPGIGYITGPADFGFKHPKIARWTEKPKVLCHPGDVLFTVKGSGVGKVNCAPPDMDCAIGRQIMALRPNRANLITDYLFYCLLGRFSEFQALRKGAAIPGIRKEDVETISIPVPPRSVQATTIQYLESIQHEVGEMQDTTDSTLLDHLEQSILAQAFRGEA